ncbi:RHS repeat-associated core domain-containing protein [Phenylobacterium sp.]|uniref:RHS repeat-associated core domain-containing protein n=1 Tax=Phenylobacterium sp. TaxID=1871053 RepID=UPI002FC7D0AB
MRARNRLARTIAELAAIAFILVGVPSETAWAAATTHPAAVAPVPDVVRKAHLPEPLVRTAPTTAAEDQALIRAIATYEGRQQADDFSSLAGFAASYPRSGWTAAVLTNLGLSYLHDGYFSRALDSWRAAWRLGKSAKDPSAKATIDRAFGELIRLQASLGQFDQVEASFRELGKRPVGGSATEALDQARRFLTLKDTDPRHLFNCGPVSLELLLLAIDPQDRKGDFLKWHQVGPKGTSLAELGTLANRAQFSYRVVFRSPGQAVPELGLVHWKVGHYSAIVGKANGRYHLKDPVFPGNDLWVTEAALDAEASGYFLVPEQSPADAAWRPVEARDAAKVFGKGPTTGTPPGAPHRGPGKPKKGPPKPKQPPLPPPAPAPNAPDPCKPGEPCPPPCPLCVYDIIQSAVSLTLSDTPVGYSAPIGPSTAVTITYNQREDSQPANFSYFNLGQKWTLNWLTYVIDDPTNAGANVARYLPEGGAYYYGGYSSGTGKFTADEDDGSILTRVSGTPVSYRRQLDDGSVQVFAQSDGAASYPRKVFLSQIIDPQGNAVTLNYDSQMRLTSLTDATGRQTTFAYGFQPNTLAITQITDPFGRSAVLTYDSSSRLTSITDIIGLTSKFTYDSNSLVNALITPYGTTTFAYTAPGASGPPRYVEAVDPMGFHERVEWLEPAPVPATEGVVPTGMPNGVTNNYLEYRTTFYWDKDAYVAAGCTPTGGCDYSKGVASHFLHQQVTGLKSPTLESVKHPLENRVWYNYPGQTNSAFEGTGIQPIAVGRVLDNGTTQLYRYAYDTAGFFKPTQVTDPLGRITTYTYDANHIDLTDVTQLTAGGAQASLAHIVYNTHHRPISATDAAGQTTTFTYSAAQQLTSVTNALSQTITYQYNASGDLTSITNANNATVAIYTYDAFNRIATFTDSEGWSVGYAYDAADRVTKTTYPDGTIEAYAYDKLDLVSYQDRLGRLWTYAYDANRRLTAETNPNGQQTQFAYDRTGDMTSMTDASGHVTQWAYDIQGREITKTYADSTTQTFVYETTTSRLKSVTDALSQTKSYAYAQDDALVGITYTGAVNTTPNVSFAYDTYYPRITSRTDGAGTTQFTYVAVGSQGALRVLQEATPLASGNITYAYDQLSRVTSRTVQGSGAQTFTYDGIGRLTSDANDLGSFTLGYLGETNQITSRQLASSNLATTWSYLPNSSDRRLASISTTGLTAGQYSTFAYASNSEDQTAGVTQTSDASVAYPPASLTQTASYNTLNQLTNLSGQALTWDANGNLLSDGTRTYAWDAENRLVAIGYPGQPGKATALTYDGLDRRVAISSTPAGGGSATTTSYIWCGLRLCQARDSGNSVIRAYYDEGEYVSGASYYYAPDQIGSVRRVFTSTVTPTYDYDPYGNSLQGTAPLTDLGYAGLFNSTDSGLNLATYRNYDPVPGRWLSRDPIGEQSDQAGNLYAYADGAPLSWSDPHGLQAYTGQTPPANIPGGPWSPAGPGQPPGTFYGPRNPTGGPRALCRFVPDAKNGGPAGAPDAYWKTKTAGQPDWNRFNQNGKQISPDQAHPGNSPQRPILLPGPLFWSVLVGAWSYPTPAY